MNNNQFLKSGIIDLFLETPESVLSVAYGQKKINNILTNDLSVTFGVEKKMSIEELKNKNEYIVPKKVIINNIEYLTDVIEINKFYNLACFNYQANPLPEEISRHRRNTSPLKGGVVIATNRTKNFRGTLGLICVDSETKTFVGLTNAHVGANLDEYINPPSIYSNWFTFPINYSFIARKEIIQFTETNPITSVNSIGYTKRFYPKTNLNGITSPVSFHYIDASLISLNECGITKIGDSFFIYNNPNNSYKTVDIEESFKQIGLDYNNPMPFATTSEIDSLITISRDIYSIGKTTGVKGLSLCKLAIDNIYGSTYVSAEFSELSLYVDLIFFSNYDNNDPAIEPGDSGSILIANFDGIFKIIGLVFAGDAEIGAACRIDNVAEMLGVEAWSNQTKYFTKNNEIKLFIEPYNNISGQFLNQPNSKLWPIKKTIENSGNFWYCGLARIGDLTGIGISGAEYKSNLYLSTQYTHPYPNKSSLIEEKDSQCTLETMYFINQSGNFINFIKKV